MKVIAPLAARRWSTLSRQHARSGFALVAIAGAYFAAGKFGIALSVADGVVTPVWIPTGIAIAAGVLLGYRVWPAIAIAAFLVNFTSGAEWPVALAIAAGNTLEALTATYLLRRARFSPDFGRVRDVLVFAILGAALATTVSATVGTSALALAGTADHSFLTHWRLWWSGDAAGALMVTPVLLVGYTAGRELLRRRIFELAALLGAIVGLAAFVVIVGGPEHRYLVFPALLWAAIRFRQLGAAAASFVLGAIGTWGALSGAVALSMSSPTERLQSIHMLVAVVTVSLLVVGATLAERERAHAALRRTARELEEAQRLAHVGSWEWLIPTNKVSWSAEMYRIWRLDPETFVPTREAFLASVHPGDRARVDVADRLARKAGELAYEFRILRPDGSERTIQSRGQLLVDETGHPERMLGTAQDVTEAMAVAAERERLLDLEREQNERLRELDRMKDGFIASVSHELRTPLTSIIGYLELLAEEAGVELTDQQRRYVEVTLRNTARLNRLIGDLLFVAQADAGRLSIEPESVDPGALVHDCLESLRPWAAEANVELHLEGRETPTVWADPARLAQLVENLVTNAIKCSRAGGRVDVAVYPVGERVLLEVKDDGYGIQLGEQEHIFERFFRTSLASEQAIQGTGLGLSIAKMIAEAHEGTLSFTSAPEQGTTFTCELPAQKSASVNGRTPARRL